MTSWRLERTTSRFTLPTQARPERASTPASVSPEWGIGAQTTSSDADSADGENDAAITSAAATGATSAISWVGLWTLATGGVFLAKHQLVDSLGVAAPVTLALGEKLNIPIDDLNISFPIA